MLGLKINPLNALEILSSHGSLATDTHVSVLDIPTSGTSTLSDPPNNYENHNAFKYVRNVSSSVQILEPVNLFGATNLTLTCGKFVALCWLYDGDINYDGFWYLVRDNINEITTFIQPMIPLEEPELITTSTTLSLDSYMSDISGNVTLTLPDAVVRGHNKLVLTQGGANVTVNCTMTGFSGFDLGANNKAHLVWDSSWKIIDAKGLTKNL